MYGLTELFEGFAAKPDIVVDDMPATTKAPFSYSVSDEMNWKSLVEEIIERHVD